MSTPIIQRLPQAHEDSELLVTYRGEHPLSVAHGEVALIPAGSYLLLMQQMSWRARGLSLPGMQSSITSLRPEDAKGIHRFLTETYIGNAMVMPNSWHQAMVDALGNHLHNWSKEWSKDHLPADLSARDGIESALASEILGIPDFTNPSEAAVEKLLSGLGAAYPGFGAQGPSPVFDPNTGEASFVDNKDLDNFLNSAGPGVGDANPGLLLGASGSDDGTSDVVEGLNKQGDAATNKGNAQLGGAAALGAGAIALCCGPLGWGALVAIVILGGGAGALTEAGATNVQKGSALKDQSGKIQEAQGREKLKGGSQIPSGADGSINDGRTIGFRMPKQSVRDLLKELQAGKLGAGTEGGDLSLSDRTYMRIKWQLGHSRGGISMMLTFNPKYKLEGVQDDTGMLARDWLKDQLLLTAAPANLSTSDGSNMVDDLGKHPSLPPKGIAFASDYVELGSSLQNVTATFQAKTAVGG